MTTTFSAFSRSRIRSASGQFLPARAAARAVATMDPHMLLTESERPDAGPHLHEAADLAAP